MPIGAESRFRGTAYDNHLQGQILEALLAANLTRVFGASALQALEVYAIPTPWLHQDTTTIALYGAYADAPQTPEAPRPAVATAPRVRAGNGRL